MAIDPDDLLTESSLDAGVQALADRNAHHLAEMTPDEQRSAIEHYRELATAVLVAARATMEADEEAPSAEQQPGRAVIVFEDAGDEDVTVHTAFYPRLEDVDGTEIRGTYAQIMALMFVSNLEAGLEEGLDIERADEDDED